MPSTTSHAPGLPAWLVFLLLAVAALAVRVLFFTGLGTGDDVTYMAQVLAHHYAQTWPPEATHWSTRLGLTMPTVLAVKLFGSGPISLVLLPMLIGALKVPLYWLIARRLISGPQALFAASLLLVYPLEVIFSSHLFPDSIVGFFSTIALYLFVTALRNGRALAFAGGGVCIAAAYLCRETVLLEAPVYLAIWLMAGRGLNRNVLWLAVPPILVFTAECLLYQATTGDAFYRIHSIVRQVHSAEDRAATVISSPGRDDFWLDPLLMVAGSHELGLFLLLGLPLALHTLFRQPQDRLIAVWLLAGFVWIYYGTASPKEWVPVHRVPRYSGVLTLPAIMLIGRYAFSLRPAARTVLWLVLVVSSILSILLDQRSTILAPHRRFVDSPHAADASVEPAEYLALRWVQGFDEVPAFAAASDAGRDATLTNLRHLPHATITGMESKRYFVMAPRRRLQLQAAMEAKGWHVVHTYTGEVPFGRQLLARILAWVPTQEKRAARLAEPSQLLVLERRH